MFWIWSICTGVAHGVGHPPPEPECNLEVPPPVAVPGANDEDGEDVSGPTVEAHVELSKTVGKLLKITNIPVAWQVDPDTLADDIGEPEFRFHLEHFLQEKLESGPDTDSSPFQIKFVYIHLLLLHSMHLVICAVQVACVVRASMLSLPGGVANLNMTLFLSTLMKVHLVCLDCMLLG